MRGGHHSGGSGLGRRALGGRENDGVNRILAPLPLDAHDAKARVALLVHLRNFDVGPGGEAAGRAPGGGGASAAPPSWRAGPGAGDVRRDVPLGSRHLARALQPRRRQGALQRQRAAVHARPRDRGGGGGCGCGGAAGGRSRGSVVRGLPMGGLRTRRVRPLPRRGAAVQPVHVPQDAALLRWPIAVWRVREPRAGATLQVPHPAREGRAGGHPPARDDGQAHSRRRSGGSRTSTCARA